MDSLPFDRRSIRASLGPTPGSVRAAVAAELAMRRTMAQRTTPPGPKQPESNAHPPKPKTPSDGNEHGNSGATDNAYDKDNDGDTASDDRDEDGM